MAPIEVEDYELKQITGQAKFFSITYRLFKLPNLLETLCEDYGQAVRYKGSIAGSEDAFQLDSGHLFQTGKLSRKNFFATSPSPHARLLSSFHVFLKQSTS